MSKLVGYRFSPTVQEVLHVIEAAKAPITLENLDWDATEQRKALASKTPTGTFPYLETPEGVISESKAIESYICETYKPELLGGNAFEKAQVLQWIQFATTDLYACSRSIIYPLFGWGEFNKEQADAANGRLKGFLATLNAYLKGKTFLVGEKLTLADIIMFNNLRFYYQLVWVEGFRKSVLGNITEYFTKLMTSPEAMKTYGRTLWCKVPLKAFVAEKKKPEEKKKEEKKEKKPAGDDEEPKKKEVNPLDLLPPSKFELEVFKRAFLNNKNKEEAMKNFFTEYDPTGYSIWSLEYQMLPTEGKVLFMTSNSKSMFLQKLDSFRRYSFAVHGVYGEEGAYNIRGVWMWRGTEMTNEMKQNDLYDYITFKKLDVAKEEDKQLITDYWTKLNEGDIVQGSKVADASYFN